MLTSTLNTKEHVVVSPESVHLVGFGPGMSFTFLFPNLEERIPGVDWFGFDIEGMGRQQEQDYESLLSNVRYWAGCFIYIISHPVSNPTE